MYLVTAATKKEMKSFLDVLGNNIQVQTLITGVGPVETAVRLSCFLGNSSDRFTGVVNFGIAGAYGKEVCEKPADILDICLAEKEILGDFGIAYDDKLQRFDDSSLAVDDVFVLDTYLLEQVSSFLKKEQTCFYCGAFITVSAASGSAKRGAMVGKRFKGLCENMEGAAVARVCREFFLPCLEMRCISNYVEDRDLSKWKLQQACDKAGTVTAGILKYLIK